MTDKTTKRTPLQQAEEATDIARLALASSDRATGVAAISLAAQLIQLAKILGHTE